MGHSERYLIGKFTKEEKLNGSKELDTSAGVAFLYFIILSSILAISNAEKLLDFLNHLRSTNLITPAVIFLVVVLVGSGRLMYYIKTESPLQYGIAEISASVVYCLFSVDKILDSNSDLSALGIIVTLVTSVYFVQRGFDNYFKGVKLRDEKKSEEKT